MGRPIITTIIGQVSLIAPIFINSVYFIITIPVRIEHNLRSIRGELGVAIHKGVICQVSLIASIYIHKIDFPITVSQ